MQWILSNSIFTRGFSSLTVLRPTGYPVSDLVEVSSLSQVLSKGEEICGGVEYETDHHNDDSVYEVGPGVIFKGGLDKLENDHEEALPDVEKWERCVVVVELET